jgi:hypothetical protein
MEAEGKASRKRAKPVSTARVHVLVRLTIKHGSDVGMDMIGMDSTSGFSSGVRGFEARMKLDSGVKFLG